MKLSKYIKIIALILSCVILLCACSGEGESSSDSSSLADNGENEGQAKVGYIYNDTVSRDNITYMFEKTRRDLQTALEIETCYVDNIPVSQFENAVKALKNDGCNIIVSASNVFANSAYSYAKKDKEIYMLSYGGAASLSNLTCFQPKLYQPAFICGTAAAWNSSAHKIGVVCDDAMFGSYSVINAFVLGVEQIYKIDETDVKVAFANTNSETAAAVDDLLSQGCDIIFSYQSHDYAMYYCDSLGVKSIGFTSDVNYSAEKRGLLGFYLNWATSLTDTVRTCLNNNFTPEVFIGGINEAFVKLTPYSENCKTQTGTICDTLYEYVKKGNAKIFVGELRDKDGLARVGTGTVLTHDRIVDMDYLVYGVTYIKNYIQPVEIPVIPEYTVKSEFID